jgi:hypothetical protein
LRESVASNIALPCLASDATGAAACSDSKSKKGIELFDALLRID